MPEIKDICRDKIKAGVEQYLSIRDPANLIEAQQKAAEITQLCE